MTEERRHGQVSFRLKPELHRELLSMADDLGLDLTGLMNSLIIESLPLFRERVATLRERNSAAKWGVPAEFMSLFRFAVSHGFFKDGRIGGCTKDIRTAIYAVRQVDEATMQAVLLAGYKVREAMRNEGVTTDEAADEWMRSNL